MKKINLFTLQIFCLSLLLGSCGNGAENGNQISTDSANALKTISNSEEKKIGQQIWMTSNLDLNKFQNGDEIAEAKTNEEWRKAGDEKKPAWCYYNNETANGKKYGKLYNWYAVNDPRGLAPKGWHVPSDSEWVQLTEYLGGEYGLKLKNNSGWDANGNGTNESGFAGLPGGFREVQGPFTSAGTYGGFWASTIDGKYVWSTYLDSDSQGLGRLSREKEPGLSVRCIKN